MTYAQALTAAQDLLQTLATKRDSLLEPGPGQSDICLAEAKKLDLSLRAAAAAFFSATGNPVFVDPAPMGASADQLTKIAALVAKGKCRMLEDSWSGIAAVLAKGA